jgi:hypothetical protein
MTISLNKTWERITNIATGTTITMSVANCLIAAKNAMVASGHWVVLASSDRVNVGVPGAQDLWVDSTDLVGATAGTAHSWIVLGNDSIESGFAICIDCINSDLRSNAIYCTHQGYNTDGTIQNRPTAVGSECTVHSGVWWNQSVTSATIRVIVLTSSDGQCTRIIWVYTTSYNGASKVWIFDRIKNPPSWLTHPYIAAAPLYGATATIASYINFLGTNMAYVYHTKPVTIAYGSIGIVGALGNTALGRLADPISGSIPITPIFLVSTETTVPGFFGELYDLYWLPDYFGDYVATLTGTVAIESPCIYLPTTQFDLGLFNHGCWAFGNNGEGGLY